MSCNDTHIGTRYVILAKQWMWLPDDGFIVNRNMLEINDKHIGTRYVILAKHWMMLPDDGFM